MIAGFTFKKFGFYFLFYINFLKIITIEISHFKNKESDKK